MNRLSRRFEGEEYDAMVSDLIELSHKHKRLPEFLDNIAKIAMEMCGAENHEDAYIWLKRGRQSCCDIGTGAAIGVRTDKDGI